MRKNLSFAQATTISTAKAAQAGIAAQTASRTISAEARRAEQTAAFIAEAQAEQATAPTWTEAEATEAEAIKTAAEAEALTFKAQASHLGQAARLTLDGEAVTTTETIVISGKTYSRKETTHRNSAREALGLTDATIKQLALPSREQRERAARHIIEANGLQAESLPEKLLGAFLDRITTAAGMNLDRKDGKLIEQKAERLRDLLTVGLTEAMKEGRAEIYDAASPDVIRVWYTREARGNKSFFRLTHEAGKTTISTAETPTRLENLLKAITARQAAEAAEQAKTRAEAAKAREEERKAHEAEQDAKRLQEAARKAASRATTNTRTACAKAQEAANAALIAAEATEETRAALIAEAVDKAAKAAEADRKNREEREKAQEAARSAQQAADAVAA